MEILQANEIKEECCEGETPNFSFWPLFKTEMKQEPWNQKHDDSGSAYSNQDGSFGMDKKLIHSKLGQESVHGQTYGSLNTGNFAGKQCTGSMYNPDIVTQSLKKLYDVSIKKVEGNKVTVPWDTVSQTVTQSQIINHKPLLQIPNETCYSNFLVSNEKKHTIEKSYKCDICDVAFFETGNLTQHMRSNGGYKHSNNIMCDASFTQPNHLVIHKKKHTAKIVYKCDMCNATLTQSGIVKHQSKHTGEKSYKCDMCHAAFTRSSSLVIHKRKHTGEKSYKCDMCDAAFTHSSSLVIHKRKP